MPCGMQPNFALAPNHEQIATCQVGAEKREQHKHEEAAAKAMDETFTAYGVELEQVKVFKYLVRQIRGHSNPDLEYLRTKFDTRRTKNQKPKNTNKLP